MATTRKGPICVTRPARATRHDEHGRYPPGCWLRSPRLSEHFPFVEQPTTIWVKVGHLPL